MKNKLKRRIGRKKFNEWLKSYKSIVWFSEGIPSPIYNPYKPRYNKSWDTLK
jgi:hypothetical protein